MDNRAVQPALIPNARLLIVIEANGTVTLLRQRLTPPWELDIRALEMISAFSTGKFLDIQEGLESWFDANALTEGERELCRKLSRVLKRQNRIEVNDSPTVREPAVQLDHSALSVAIPKGPLTLRTPCTFRVRDGLFEAVTHDGTRLPLITPVQLLALSKLVKNPLVADAVQAHRESLGVKALDTEQFLNLLAPFVAHRFVVARTERSGISGAELSNVIMSGHSSGILREKFRRHAEEQDAAECERELSTGVHRTKVIPVAFDHCPPAGLGAIVAYAKVYEDGALERFYNFRTDWVWDYDRLPIFAAEPAIYLFSNYLWSHAECIEASEKIKALSPNSITIHGGPDTPKYEGDQHRYFAEYPHVDIAIQGEGEVNCAEVLSRLRSVIGTQKPDFSVLQGVPGVTYRADDGIVRNSNPGRIPDLNILPSAYLTGLFDIYMGVDDLFVILETNRGCPYGCTFCDWGSATASKIRKFEMDRVMAELEWTAKAQVASVSIADANFGVFPRDVDIARKAAELKKATGYPRGFGGNYAKNTVTYLREIIDVLSEGNILTLGTLSLQSMDEDTLDVIHRSNIKTERYDALAVEMRNSKLPLTIELMMGLPGSTLSSFREDLQQCIDRELPARVNMTTLLVNSPMNEPAYLEKYQIKTSAPVAPGNLAMLASTSTYTEADLARMHQLRVAYLLFENFGVLRIISRFVRQAAGVNELNFYEKLLIDTEGHRQWPMLHLLTSFGSSLMAPPVSWYLVMDELGVYLRREYGLDDTPALRSALAAQLACLPAHDRVHPERIDLECDVVAWHHAMVSEKERGNRRDWASAVPGLSTYGPGSLTVDDPFGLTQAALGINRELNAFGLNWELTSPLHRARADLA